MNPSSTREGRKGKQQGKLTMDYRLFGSVERTKWRGRVECEVSGGCLMGEEIERAVGWLKIEIRLEHGMSWPCRDEHPAALNCLYSLELLMMLEHTCYFYFLMPFPLGSLN
ncbi:cAMP-dependent protein kinase inhibitor-related protein [Corchorus olitorius]|uniref:cAMP-dependent protein kinase inhibitor-related protein n=1 Tax=Corchorus olitorius TaxID=93759 RepID=A0A1R3KHK1_9ROSI|nr:cAMP-dependent protein kinase inhibitor-related protein [Corchorus olitorius]